MCRAQQIDSSLQGLQPYVVRASEYSKHPIPFSCHLGIGTPKQKLLAEHAPDAGCLCRTAQAPAEP